MATIAPPRSGRAIRTANPGNCVRQRGVTLVVSLLFLLLMTILGVTALNTSTLQEKMAGNLRDQDLAFQAAESALRAGEEALQVTLLTADAFGDLTCASKICKDGVALPLDDVWWSSNSIEYGGAGSDLGLAEDPRYVIEYVQEVSPSILVQQSAGSKKLNVRYYRVTARAFGATRNAQSALESSYRVPE